MIEVVGATKIFKKPVREKGLWGMLKTLFSFKFEEKVAVDNVSFTIQDGEIVGYIGANGAGKSTTIKMMSGILTPTSGKVLIDGKEPYHAKHRMEVLKHVGVVFGQKTQLWWDLPLIETFELLKHIYEIDETEYQERMAYFNEVLGLQEFASSQVRTLSLGQRMRADLAAALLHNPRILFLDEPTIGLDVLVKENIRKAIKEIHAKYNTTIVLTTHDMSDIENLCSKIVIIDRGKVIFNDKIEKIKEQFGDIREIKVDLEKESAENVDLAVFQSMFPDHVWVNQENNTLLIRVDANQLSISSVLAYVFQQYAVSDVKIGESSIEHVVKQLYETHTFS